MSPSQKWLFQLFVCPVLISAGAQALALDCASAPVPYSANYSVTRNGDPDGSMHVVLQRKDVDRFSYRMETRVKWGIFTAYIEQQSDFSFMNGTIMPGSYKLTQRVTFYRRHETVEFDWVSMKASGEKKQADFVVDIVPGMQDKLSVYLLLAQSLCRGEYAIDADVVSGPSLKSYDYRFQGKEPLDTALGRLQVIHIRRGASEDEKQTDLWHAEQTHFLPVKMVYRDQDVSTEMRLTDISFEEK